MDADLPTVIGETNQASSPTAYLLGALAGFGVAFLYDTLAPQFGVRIDAVTAVARCSTDRCGLIGMEGASPERMDIVVEIEVSTTDPPDRTRRDVRGVARTVPDLPHAPAPQDG